MIPAEVIMKLATLGLDERQAEAVATMLADVEAATLSQAEEGLEKSREKARARWRKWVGRLDVPRSEWIGLSELIKQRDNYTCVYCGETEGTLDCDHVVPLSRGGTSIPDNLVTACRACNGGKSGRTPEQWRGLQ